MARAGEPPASEGSERPLQLAELHGAIGWGLLAVAIAGGLTLEALHGFKVGFYVNADMAVRREMWTLAHAHLAGVSLVHLALAATIGRASADGDGPYRTISALITAGSVLLPGGFFIGGLGASEADPGLGIVLTPVGGLVLLAGVVQSARVAWRRSRSVK